MELVAKIKARQQAESLTGENLAELLGITEGHLYHVYSGRRKPGLRFLAAIIRIWPDMEEDVVQYLETRKK